MADSPHPSDPGLSRGLEAEDARLDAANQSLADALRATFRILKAVMVLLVIAFLLSGVIRVDENEEAIVLRFGRPTAGVRDPGLSLAWPFPIDETIRLPVNELKTLDFEMHWTFERTPRGLDPVRNGALLTGDRGLVYVKWTLTYKIDDIEDFVSTLADSGVGQEERIESLLANLLENAAVVEAAGMTAIDIFPRSPETLAKRVRNRLTASLETIGSGLDIVALVILESGVPGPARQAFLDVTKQQSTRQRLIRDAQRKASDKLNGAAGDTHKLLLATLDRRDAAENRGDAQAIAAAEDEIDQLLEHSASGAAGAMLAEANAYYAQTVHAIQADVHEYEILLPEYRRSPELLITRLWQETKGRVLAGPGVEKRFLPSGNKEVRINIGVDPLQNKLDERDRLLKEHKHAEADAVTPTIGRRGQR